MKSNQSDLSLRCLPEESLGPLIVTNKVHSEVFKTDQIQVDAHADLSLRWAHRSFGLFCHVQAHKTDSAEKDIKLPNHPGMTLFFQHFMDPLLYGKTALFKFQNN